MAVLYWRVYSLSTNLRHMYRSTYRPRPPNSNQININIKCEFGTFESDMIRDKVVFGVRDERIKERLLREADLTLNKALDICRAAETSKQQIEAMGATQTQVPVHTMQARKKGGRYKKTTSMPTQSSDDKREYNTPACKYCGRSHAPRQCSAFGKVCRKCGGSNHFAYV